MKPLTTVLLLVTSLSSYAQWRTTTIQTPYGKTNVTTYTPQPYIYYGSGAVQSSSKYRFTIVLKTDTTLQAKTKIDLSGKPDKVKIKVNKKKRTVVPADTKEIYRVMPDGRKLSGMPADSCWLFKVIERKKINAYSDMPVRGYMYAKAIQLGDDGEIVPLTLDNLAKMIGETNDPELQRLIRKKKVLSALAHVNGDVFF